ncbi:MAG: permease [Candidatus Krumholzibacteriota bacterium]|nr:permease [Candidatus Krumholzibacteriota bacterium]
MKRENIIYSAIVSLFISFIGFSYIFHINIGKAMYVNFTAFAFDMLKIVPCAFILIGLFEIWVKRSTVERHLGHDSGVKRYIWAIMLAWTSVGGLYMAFPIAYSLYKKGAEPSMILTYVGASGIFRLPMTIFEASFLGLKFTLVRLAISLPLTILVSVLLGRYMKRHNIPVRERPHRG